MAASGRHAPALRLRCRQTSVCSAREIVSIDVRVNRAGIVVPLEVET